MSVVAERTAIELAGKIRMIATCSACRNMLQGSNIVSSCSHYLCADCASNKTECPRCLKPGIIRRAEYFDKVAATLYQMREILMKECQSENRNQPQNTSKKRKPDNAFFSEDERPSPKVTKPKSTATKKAQTNSPHASQNNVGGNVIFAKKSTPATPSTPQMGASDTGGGQGRPREVATPTGVSGSVIPKKLLKQTILSPMLASQRAATIDSDDGTTTSQETDFSFSAVATQMDTVVIQQQQQQPVVHQTQKHFIVTPSQAHAAVPSMATVRSSCCSCQCDKSTSVEIAMKNRRNSAVQVENNVLTLDVSTSTPRVIMKDASTLTDPMVINNRGPAQCASVDVQTERPYIAPPKLYREAFIQTDPTLPDEPSDADQTLRPESPQEAVANLVQVSARLAEQVAANRLCPPRENATSQLPPLTTDRGHDSRSSTQTEAGQSIHAQPMSLDVSPIKQTATKCAAHGDAGSGNDQDKSSPTIDARQVEPDATSEKDSLDSVDFTSCERLAKRQAIVGAGWGQTAAKTSSNSETDSLASIQSQMFQKVQPFKGSTSERGRSSRQKDTLESMLRSSQSSIPETLPPMVSPAKISAKATAGMTKMASRSVQEHQQSQMSPDDSQIVLPARKTLDLSDEEAEDFMANIDTQMVASKRTKSGTNSKVAKGSNKSEKNRRNNLLMSSDEENADDETLANVSVRKRQTAQAKNLTLQTIEAMDTNEDNDDEEDDEAIAPLDTEDMKNLEREIENLDREMEDSKNTASFRKSR